METVDTYFAARRQESSHAACAALRLAGIDCTPAGVLATSRRAAGRYSDLSIMDAIADYFTAANSPQLCEHGILEGDWCEDCNREYKQAMEDNE